MEIINADDELAKNVGKGALNSARLTLVDSFPEQYVKQQDVGEFSHVCQFCSALSWPKERATLCCKGGNVVLPAIPEPPHVLMELFNANQSFLKRIRSFNNTFALASIGCKQIQVPYWGLLL